MIISSRQSMKEGFGREHATGDQCPSLEKKWKAKRNGKQSLSLSLVDSMMQTIGNGS